MLSRDVANVVRATYGEVPPPIILVGHSMGGAIAVHAASGSVLPSVVGLVVIDVVEGERLLWVYNMLMHLCWSGFKYIMSCCYRKAINSVLV